ncbi:hypothetical protein KY327_02945 [Candidatus Woesearchaeota archaeon]|nr:hypothetical protein [Candidatus Woesearchaeota archaeon]
MRRYLLVAVFAFSLLLAGCAQESGPTGQMRTFIGGTEGVEVGFEVGAPPNEVNTGDDFNVLVVLENMGEHTVEPEDYFVQLRGFSPADFSTSNDALNVSGTDIGEPLQANEMNPDTGEVLESYPVFVDIPQTDPLQYVGDLGGNMQFPFRADVCYTYKTRANAKLCIKRDLSDTTDTEVCTISGAQTITSSGAPVQLSNFKEFSGGSGGVRFSFDVVAANTGGALSAPGSGCSKQHNDEDKVHIRVTTGFDGLNCNGFVGEQESGNGWYAGSVKLTGSSRQITCRQDISSAERGDYVKVININATYDYRSSASKRVLVKQVSN